MAVSTDVEISEAESAADIATVAGLFEAYVDTLPIDISYQNFADELASLPGCYAAPRGCILFAKVKGTAVGCVALRPLSSDTGEIKRLYLLSQARASGIATTLVKEIERRARTIGYSRILLDTLAEMQAAIRLYHHLGFQETEKYYDTPIQETRFFEKGAYVRGNWSQRLAILYTVWSIEIVVFYLV